VAEYAEILRDSYWAKESSLASVSEEANRIANALAQDEAVQEFAGLVNTAVSLTP
jgi:hypothetical protein